MEWFIPLKGPMSVLYRTCGLVGAFFCFPAHSATAPPSPRDTDIEDAALKKYQPPLESSPYQLGRGHDVFTGIGLQYHFFLTSFFLSFGS